MSFHKDLKDALRVEKLVSSIFLSQDSVKGVYEVGKDAKTDYDRRELQREFGDLQVVLHSGNTIYVEVKSDGKMGQTGNLGLEVWSDNGERTGRKTVGWFNNENAQYDWFFFYNRLEPSQCVMVKRKELKELCKSGECWMKQVPMTYDQLQANRSEVLLVKHSDVVKMCPSGRYVDLSNAA